MTPAMFREVVRLAEERGILLFSDEVYREAEYREADRLPAACDLSEACVSLGVMSKSYGLPGLRIGWLATRNARLLHAVAALKDYTTICSRRPASSWPSWPCATGRRSLRRNLEIIRRQPARAGRLSSPATPSASPGAARWPGRSPSRACSARMSRASATGCGSAGVLLLPGSVFGDRGNHFRIGFGRADCPEAVARLEEGLEEALR